MIWNIIYLSILTTGSLFGVIRFRKLNNSNKFFLLLLLCTIVAETIGWFTAKGKASNFIVYHIFTPVQCTLVFLGYYYDLKKKVLLYSIPFIVFTGLILSLFIQPLPAFNSYFMEIELLLFSLVTIYYFSQLLKVETDINLKDYPLFWISSGLIIFSVSNIFIMGAYNFFIKSNSPQFALLNTIFFYIRLFSNYIYYSSFIVAFLVKQNTISDQYGK